MTYSVMIDGVVREVAGKITADRMFRDAWTLSAKGTLQVDLEKAKQIWRDKIRAARAPVLAALDAEFMRALESGVGVDEVVAKKAALRDAPADPRIDTVKKVADLYKIKPAGLTIKTWGERDGTTD